VKEIRAFIAIELSKEIREALTRLQERLKSRIPHRSVRWVRVEGIHLTLKFLGDVPASSIDGISQALEVACGGFEPFTLEAAGLGCFPNSRRPRVLWVGVREESGVLNRLQKSVEDELARLGFERERRSFNPHLTLGRVQRRVSHNDRQRLGELIAESEVGLLDSMRVPAVKLMRSDLQPAGAVYTALARVALGSG